VLAASDGSQQKLMAMCIGLKVNNVLFEVTNKNFSLIPRNKHLIDKVKRQAKLIPGCLHVTTSNCGKDWLLKWLEEHPIVNEIDVLFLCSEEEKMRSKYKVDLKVKVEELPDSYGAVIGKVSCATKLFNSKESHCCLFHIICNVDSVLAAYIDNQCIFQTLVVVVVVVVRIVHLSTKSLSVCLLNSLLLH
jgi:hypothetical protein